MTDLVLDRERSRVRIHTFAEGLLARLAHDLELVCGDLTGTATRGANPNTGAASIDAPLKAITVAGVLRKDGRVDPRGLSPTEQRDCLAKMHRDVFGARPDAVVRVEVHHDGTAARVRIVAPNGKSVDSLLHPTICSAPDTLQATGSLTLSLQALGSLPIKAPMNAFRVKDLISISFHLLFTLP